MRRLIDFPLADGTVLRAEVDEPVAAGPRPAGAGGSAIERATRGIDQAISKIRPLAESLLSQLSGLATKPDEIGVEFGIKLSVDSGIILASA